MGFFDRFFRKHTNIAKAEIKTANRETLDVSKEIDEILYILKELRFMDAYSIEREMDQKKKSYDKSILYRLMIDRHFIIYHTLAPIPHNESISM